MREVLKTSISKYGPKTNAAITVENVQGKGLQLAIVYAGRKYYLPLSSVPLNPDEHANHPNHQKIKVDHNGKVGIGTANPAGPLEISSSDADEPNVFITNTSASQQAGGDLIFRTEDTDTDLGDNIVLGEILWQGLNISHSPDEYQVAARITGRKDGATASADDMGGELAFFTTADGSSDSTTQRMCIREDGKVGIGTGVPGAMLDITSASSTAQIHLNSAANNNATILFQEAGTQVWQVFADISGDDKFYIRDAGSDDGMYLAQGGAAWVDASDERLKHNLTPIENAVDKLNTLQAINFQWKYGSEERKAKNNLGLLAQEVYEVFPEAVDAIPNEDFKLIDHPTIAGEKAAEGAWGIGKGTLIPVLVKAIQELSDKVTALESK